MQLDTDALTDLVMLRPNAVEPTVVMTSSIASIEANLPSVTKTSKATTNLAKLDKNDWRGTASAVGAPQKSQTNLVTKSAATQATTRVKKNAKESRSIRPLGGGCPSSPITLDQTINGTLATTDCFLDDGNYVDVYTFNGTSGQQVSITLDSADFDTYLYLLAPDGSLLESDDDGGGGTNSQIPSAGGFVTLPANGAYTIYATSFSAEEVGAYSLSLTAPGGGGACPATPIFSGQGIAGSLSTTDCAFDSGDRDGSFLLTFIPLWGSQVSRPQWQWFQTRSTPIFT